jgi:hypothetical protein
VVEDAGYLRLRPRPVEQITRGQHTAEIGQKKTNKSDAQACSYIAPNHIHVYFRAGEKS